MDSEEGPPQIKLENFVNFDELKQASFDMDDEKRQENFEMTE